MGFGLAHAFVEFGSKGEGKLLGTLSLVDKKLQSVTSAPVGQLASRFTGLASRITGLLNPLSLLSATLGSLGAGAGVGGMVSMAASAERIRAELNVLTGSAEKTKEVLGELKAAFVGTSVSAEQYRAVAQDMISQTGDTDGVAEDIIKLGKIAVATGASLEQMASAYDRAEMTGKVTMRTLMAMQPVATQLQKAYKLTEDELAQMATDGVIKIDHLKWAIEQLAGEGGRFAGILDAQKNTLLGQWDILKANVANILRDIGQQIAETFELTAVTANFSSFAATFKANYGDKIRSALEWIRDTSRVVFAFIYDNSQWLVPAILGVAGAFIGVKVAGGAASSVMGQLSSVMPALGAGAQGTGTAIMTIGRSLMSLIANPVTATIAGVLALTGVLWQLGYMMGWVSKSPMQVLSKEVKALTSDIAHMVGIKFGGTNKALAKFGKGGVTKGVEAWQETQAKATAAGAAPALTAKPDKTKAESAGGAQFVSLAGLAEKMQQEAAKLDMAREQLQAAKDSEESLSRLAGAVQGGSLQVVMANSGPVATEGRKWW